MRSSDEPVIGRSKPRLIFIIRIAYSHSIEGKAQWTGPEQENAPPNSTGESQTLPPERRKKNLVKYKDHTLSKLHNLLFFQVFPGHRPPQPENPLPEPSTPDPRVTGRKKNYR